MKNHFNYIVVIFMLAVLGSCKSDKKNEPPLEETTTISTLGDPSNSKGLKENKILFWGPQGFVLDSIIPNANKEGDIGMYFQLSNSSGLEGIDLQIGEVVIPTVTDGNGLLTAYFDVKGIASPKNIMVSLIDKKQNLKLTVGEFKVTR